MAKRTLAQKYEEYDTVNSIRRKVLTWTQDAREICYDIEADHKPTEDVAIPTVSKQDDVTPPQLTQVAQPISASPEKVAAIPDHPLAPTEVLRAIIAQKLKRSIKDVAPRSSIKELAGG